MPTRTNALNPSKGADAPRLRIFAMDKLSIPELVGTVDNLSTLAAVASGFANQPRLDTIHGGAMFDDLLERIVGERSAAIDALAGRSARTDFEERERDRALAVAAVTDGRPVIEALEDELARVRAGGPRTPEKGHIGKQKAAPASGGYDLNDLHSEIGHLAGLLDVVVYQLVQGATLGPEARQVHDCLHIAADEARRLVDRVEENFQAIGSTTVSAM